MSSSVTEEIQTEKLLLQTPKLYGRYWLIPYHITGQSVFPEGFYNVGQPYQWEEPSWLQTCSSTRHFSQNHWDFYYCMILPGHFQRAGVFIKLFKTNNQIFMGVDFFGPLLGLKEEDANTDGYAHWSDIKVSLTCNSKNLTYSLPNIGYNPRSHHDLIAVAQSLTSPLRLKYAIPCKREEISQISLRFKHLKRYLHDYSETTPQQKEIVWNILTYQMRK